MQPCSTMASASGNQQVTTSELSASGIITPASWCQGTLWNEGPYSSAISAKDALNQLMTDLNGESGGLNKRFVVVTVGSGKPCALWLGNEWWKGGLDADAVDAVILLRRKQSRVVAALFNQLAIISVA